tara:strand:+ start:1060 stop:1476 length:417 start_codon:yes stop_codon:yes gene_type:complete
MLKRFNTNDYLIRIPLFIIFFWFGILKVLKMSPATELIIDTVFWMPLLSAENWVIIIGYWEMAIGLCFLNKKTTLIAVILMFLQMSGTFLPLVILPEITFQNSNPFIPTLEGQYIIKNIIIITAALIIGRSYLKIKIR